MTKALLLLLIVPLYTIQNLFCKIYSNRYQGDPVSASWIYLIFCGALNGTVGLIMVGENFSPQPLTVLLACINAFALIGYYFCMVNASVCGPYSMQMVSLLSGGILIPIFASAFFGDTISIGKWISVILILAAILMSSVKKDDQKIQHRIFFLLCIGLFVSNGVYSSLLDVQQRLTGESEQKAMLIMTYGLTAIGAFFVELFRKKKEFCNGFRQKKITMMFMIIGGVAEIVAVNLFVSIIPFVNTALLYSVNNAGVLLLSVISSCILFRERLSVTNWIGCIVMCFGLVGVCVF